MACFCYTLNLLLPVSFVITCLCYFEQLRRLEAVLQSVLACIRSKLYLSFNNTVQKTGGVFLAVFWLVLATSVIPAGLVELFVLFTTRFSPPSLIYNPQFGFYALIPGSLFLVTGIFSSKVRHLLFGGGPNVSRHFYFKLFINAYGFFLVALLLPWAIFELFDTVVPTELIIMLLIIPVFWFYAYGFVVLGTAIFGLLWLSVVIPYLLFHVLSIPPKGALVTIGFIITCATFFAAYVFGLC